MRRPGAAARARSLCCGGAGPTARRACPPRYVGIGYVFGWAASIIFSGHYKAILRSGKPKFFIQGDRDEFTGISSFEAALKESSASGPTESKVYPGLNHFELEVRSVRSAPCASRRGAPALHQIYATLLAWPRPYLRVAAGAAIRRGDGRRGSRICGAAGALERRRR